MARLAPRPTRQTRAKHGGRKLTVEERLLAAMERLLEQGHSFGSVSVEQLTAEAGMSRGTFYLHFRDKGELVARLMSLVTDDVVSGSGTWLANADNPQREDIGKALFGVARKFKKHHAILVALNDTAPHDETVARLYRDMMNTICQRCRHSVAAVTRDGLAPPDANDDVADALSWFVVLYLGRFSPLKKGADLDRLLKAAVHICERAVFAD